MCWCNIHFGGSPGMCIKWIRFVINFRAAYLAARNRTALNDRCRWSECFANRWCLKLNRMLRGIPVAPAQIEPLHSAHLRRRLLRHASLSQFLHQENSRNCARLVPSFTLLHNMKYYVNSLRASVPYCLIAARWLNRRERSLPRYQRVNSCGGHGIYQCIIEILWLNLKDMLFM